MAHDTSEITELKDGKLVVKAVQLTGTILSKASTREITTLVDTSKGKELAVKVTGIGGGGGGDAAWGSITGNLSNQTDLQTELDKKLSNTATGNNSLTVGGTASTANFTTNIGKDSSSAANRAVSFGYSAIASGGYSVAIGTYANARGAGSTAIGCGNGSGGGASCSGDNSIALGAYSKTTATHAIQIGSGTNSTADTIQIEGNQFYNLSKGKVLMARLPILPVTQAEYDALVQAGTVDSSILYLITPAS